MFPLLGRGSGFPLPMKVFQIKVALGSGDTLIEEITAIEKLSAGLNGTLEGKKGEGAGHADEKRCRRPPSANNPPVL